MAITNVATNGRRPDRLNLGVPFYEFIPQVGELIGTQILPTTPTGKKNAEWPAITRESMMRRPTNAARRADGQAFGRGGYEIDMIEFNCKGFGHEVLVPKGFREVYADEFDADEVARRRIERVLSAEQEIRIAAQIFNVDSDHWDSSDATLYTNVGTDWDAAAATIISDVEGAKVAVRGNCGMSPNTMVISWRHLQSFKLNTEMKQYYFPGIPVLTEAMLFSSLPGILGIPRILIGAGVYNSGGEGDAFTLADIWEDTYCWIGVVPDGADPSAPGVGRTFQWDAFSADGYEWAYYPEQQTKVDVWQAEHWTHEKVIDPLFGHVLEIDT